MQRYERLPGEFVYIQHWKREQVLVRSMLLAYVNRAQADNRIIGETRQTCRC